MLCKQPCVACQIQRDIVTAQCSVIYQSILKKFTADVFVPKLNAMIREMQNQKEGQE